MEREAYESMYQLEDSFWWYAGMRVLLRTLLADSDAPQGRARVLDAGCGTGANLKHFANLGTLTGVDIDRQALEFCRQRQAGRLAQASVDHLPFADQSFDLVLSLEVLYHAQVDDEAAALAEARRVLAPGGYCALRLPAYQWLRGAHDVAVHTRRRYTAASVRRLAAAADFRVERLTYLNALLLPLAVLRRLAVRQGDARKSDVQPLWPPLNAALAWTLSSERRLLKHWNLPAGLSVFALLRKPA